MIAASNTVAELPPSARIRFIREALTKERGMRSRVLKGAERERQLEEVEICLDYLSHIEAALQQAKGVVISHKEMCGRLRACAERHGLEIGGDYLDQVVIAALDAREGRKHG